MVIVIMIIMTNMHNKRGEKLNLSVLFDKKAYLHFRYSLPYTINFNMLYLTFFNGHFYFDVGSGVVSMSP